MGRAGSWGQGRGWSLVRSEVEPAPFSWGSQIVAMRGRWGRVGACPCICLGSLEQAAPSPGIPASRALLLPPCPLPGAIVHGLCHISGLGPSAQPFGGRGSRFILLKYQPVQRELHPCTSLPIDRFHKL